MLFVNAREPFHAHIVAEIPGLVPLIEPNMTLMEKENASKGRLIARNTLMLYVRMLFLMLVSLYTSRVVLASLGEEDYGIYNVIGGVVAMFTVVSGALSSAVTRFITFGLAKGDREELRRIYSVAVTVQAFIAVAVVLLAEPSGLWFIMNKMTIDPSRIPAARMVLHCSVFSFAVNLMSVPQMASITAHERMDAYAGIGIFDGLCRLAVAFLITVSPADRLVSYALLMSLVTLLVRGAYTLWCRMHFSECRYRFVFDRRLIREMSSFAGWNFIGVASGVLRDHGGNILVNIFSGPAVNAARGVAVQLNGAVQGFVSNFMTAVNPQITKSYAGGEKEYMFSLMLRSSRMSFYLLLVLALPVLFNTEYLLGLWLKDVPEHSSLFVRLFLIFALSESLSSPLITGMLATGSIRNYQIIVGGLQLLNLPVSYVLLKAGCMPEVTVAVAIVLSQVCLAARLVLLGRKIGFPVGLYVRKVWLNVAYVAALACAVPLFLDGHFCGGFAGFVMSAVVCFCCACLSVLWAGCSRDERKWIWSMLRKGGKG